MYGTLFSLLDGINSRAFSPLSECALYMENTQCIRQTKASSDVAFPAGTSLPHPTSTLRPGGRILPKASSRYQLLFPGQVQCSRQDSGEGGMHLVWGGSHGPPRHVR